MLRKHGLLVNCLSLEEAEHLGEVIGQCSEVLEGIGGRAVRLNDTFIKVLNDKVDFGLDNLES